MKLPRKRAQPTIRYRNGEHVRKFVKTKLSKDRLYVRMLYLVTKNAKGEHIIHFYKPGFALMHGLAISDLGLKEENVVHMGSFVRIHSRDGKGVDWGHNGRSADYKRKQVPKEISDKAKAMISTIAGEEIEFI